MGDGLSDRAVERVASHVKFVWAAGCEYDYTNVKGLFKTMGQGTRPELDDQGFETYERAAEKLVDSVIAVRDRLGKLAGKIIPDFPTGCGRARNL